MSSPFYRSVIKQAWAVAVRHRHLWWLGFLAALLGNGGEYEFVLRQFNQVSSGGLDIGESALSALGAGGVSILEGIAIMFGAMSGRYIALGALAFVFLFILGVVIMAQGALIKAAADADRSSAPALGETLRAARRSFWHVLGIVLSARLGALIVFSIIGLPLAALLAQVTTPARALLLVFFVVGVPIFIITSLVTKYAISYRMTAKLSWTDSLTFSLRLFISHWLVSLETAFLVFAINIGAGIAIVLIILFLSSPFLLLGDAVSGLAYPLVSRLLYAAGEMLAFLLLLILGSALATFQYAVWVKLFQRIREKRHESKIVRLLTDARDRHQR